MDGLAQHLAELKHRAPLYVHAPHHEGALEVELIRANSSAARRWKSLNNGIIWQHIQKHLQGWFSLVNLVVAVFQIKISRSG